MPNWNIQGKTNCLMPNWNIQGKTNCLMPNWNIQGKTDTCSYISMALQNVFY